MQKQSISIQPLETLTCRHRSDREHSCAKQLFAQNVWGCPHSNPSSLLRFAIAFQVTKRSGFPRDSSLKIADCVSIEYTAVIEPQHRDPSLGSSLGTARVLGRDFNQRLRTQAKQVARRRLHVASTGISLTIFQQRQLPIPSDELGTAGRLPPQPIMLPIIDRYNGTGACQGKSQEIRAYHVSHNSMTRYDHRARVSSFLYAQCCYYYYSIIIIYYRILSLMSGPGFSSLGYPNESLLLILPANRRVSHFLRKYSKCQSVITHT